MNIRYGILAAAVVVSCMVPIRVAAQGRSAGMRDAAIKTAAENRHRAQPMGIPI